MADSPGPGVRTLTYPTKVKVALMDQPGLSHGHPPSPPPEDKDREPRRRRLNLMSPSSSSPALLAAPGEASISGQPGRALAHARLGPCVHEGADQDPSWCPHAGGTSSPALTIDCRAGLSAGLPPRKEDAPVPEIGRIGTKDAIHSMRDDDAVITGSSPDRTRSCD